MSASEDTMVKRHPHAGWSSRRRRGRALGGARPGRRFTSLLAIFLLLYSHGIVLFPSLKAETAGATAPEVTKFEPVDTTDLVNLASGDFTYNIPILNVPGPEGGYPLSLNYHSGVQHGEEASWVGLGWNLQPGSITRTVRGYPDDFCNVGIDKQFLSNPTQEYSVGVGFANYVGVGVTYNTSRGFGGYVGYGPAGGGLGARATYYGDGEWSVSLGYTMAGGGMGMGVSYSSSGAVGLNVSGPVGGGSSLTRLGLSVNTDAHGSSTVGVTAAMNQGVSISWDSAGQVGIGGSGRIDQKATGGASFSTYSGGGVQHDWVGVSIPIWGFTLDLGYARYWIDKTEFEQAYGYFNHHLQNASNNRVNEWIMENNPKAVPGDDPQASLGTGFNYLPSYDSYTVMGQGTGGNIRPTRLRDWVYRPKRVDDKWTEAQAWPWPDSNGFDNNDDRARARFVFDGDNSEIIPANSLNLSRVGLTARGSDGQGTLLATVADPGTPSNQLMSDIQSLLPVNDPLSMASFNGSQADALYLGKAYRPEGGSRVVNPLLDPNDSTFLGFDIWEVDGKRYLYREAVFNLWSENVAGNAYDRTGDWFRSRATINKAYAYAWYISELRFPDYCDRTGDGLSDDDFGGWVKFTYATISQDYRWHTSPDGEFNDGPMNRVQEVGQKKAGMMYGMEYGAKNLKYPARIDTSTHTAFFSISPRLDAQEAGYIPKVFDSNNPNSVQYGCEPRNKVVKLAKLGEGIFELECNDSIQDIVGYVSKSATGIPGNGVVYTFGPQQAFVGRKYIPTLQALGMSIDINNLNQQWNFATPPPKKTTVLGLRYVECYTGFNHNVDFHFNCQVDRISYNTVNSNITISINGVPVTVKSATIEYWETPACSSPVMQDLNCWDMRYPPFSGNVYAVRNVKTKLQILMADQVWGNTDFITKNPGAMSEVKNAWNAMALDAQKNSGNVTIASPRMMKLDNIYLIEKSTNKLVKQVHFEYDYSLCPGTPNSPIDSVKNPTGGKLTLKSVQVFGQEGMGPGASWRLPPYRFFYAHNPAYGSKYAYDRWGFHKSNGAMWQHRDAVPADQDAWDLTRVQLPTGGDLYIQYEPKDYARVQDRRPQNAAANKGMVGQYLVDLQGWLNLVNPVQKRWPITPDEWATFRTKVGTTPMQTYAPGGETSAGVPKVASTLPASLQTFAPLDSAPMPRDLVRWWSKNQAFVDQQTKAKAIPQMNISSTPSSYKPIPMAPGAAGLIYAPGNTPNDLVRNTRMVNLVFEYFTAGNAATAKYRRMNQPLDELKPDEVSNARTEEDRRTVQTSSVMALMTTDAATNRTNIVVIDPDFRWPRKAPSAIYVTWTHPSAKVGGGVRVKRVVASDGQRSFATSYSYRDLVDGEWTTSGVAVTEPPPFGYSVDDDRVIFPESGGWANEKGGGIVHSRVVVRHSWSEDPAPAGNVNPVSSKTIETPGGESVFRFISPADLPHRFADAGHRTVNNGGKDLRVKVTEIFNMGAWWGQLMWREDRDAKGRPIQRTENRFTQLDGYLRYFPTATTSDGIPVGTDSDVEYLNNGASGSKVRSDRWYDWAEKPTNTSDRSLPSLADSATSTVSDQSFNKTSGYLNASLNVTLAYRADSTLAGVYGTPFIGSSSVELVRELSLRPLVSETRTYSEGAPADKPTTVKKNMVWDARTGQVLETWTKGRTSPLGTVTNPYEWLISRTWPAYWVYPGMSHPTDSSNNVLGYGTPFNSWAYLESVESGVVNMLSQTTQTTTSRAIPGATGESYLNSKIETWWKAPGGYVDRWMKGGDFVWNGSGTVPPAFKGYPSVDNWTPAPANLSDIPGGDQRYKATGWLFAGAVTNYDAYAHAIEAVEGDGIWSCSKYGYSLVSTQDLSANPSTRPAGTLPIAKFSNARDGETLYLNFEDPVKKADGSVLYSAGVGTPSDDPMARLANAYTGEKACNVALTLVLPSGSVATQINGQSLFELRYFVKAASAAAAKASYPNPGEVVGVNQSEGGWWLVRAKVASNQTRIIGGNGALVDDVSVFPWRRNGAPSSVSHFAYDRATGLVTSITGSNGRTHRYRYDKLGRLMTVYDVYGNPSAATRYYHKANK